MARQSVTITKTVRTVRLGTNKREARVNTAKGSVTVKPHVRLVNGKPVYVAGYSYRR